MSRDGQTSPSRDLSRWLELNERQRAYLASVYKEDQREEAVQRSAWSRGTKAAPAEEWRWILYGTHLVDETPLRSALEEKGLVDGGTGSTFAALASRDLLMTRKSLMGVQLLGAAGHVEVLYVRLTRQGRAAIRAAIRAATTDSTYEHLLTEDLPVEELPEGCLPGETKLPPGTLRAWHWRALALAYEAYAAGEGGEPQGLSSKYGGEYAGIRERTWQRLHNYRDGALVVERETGTPWGPGPAYTLSITEAGRKFYEERWEEYRRRYPRVESPRPSTDR
ncbi:MAG: hypothetical protein ACFB50_14565 [Rubrobacteraceae bacterium]